MGGDPRDRGEDRPPKENRSQVNVVEAEICLPLSRSSGTSDLETYRSRLWHDGTSVAHANIYPLGKPKLGSLPACYEFLFGYGSTSEDLRRYRADVALIRFPRFRDARATCRPQAIVCMGKIIWSTFKEVFELRGDGIELEADRVFAWPDQQVILAPHFAYGHLNDECKARIGRELSTWGIVLP